MLKFRLFEEFRSLSAKFPCVWRISDLSVPFIQARRFEADLSV